MLLSGCMGQGDCMRMPLNDGDFLALPVTASLVLWFPLAFLKHITVIHSLHDLYLVANFSVSKVSVLTGKHFQHNLV
jgi:hypothetical protein